MTQVSIVISSFNKKGFVTVAVDSALAQTYPNVEVVVVDDGSIDGSPDTLQQYGDRIVFEAKQNGGQGSALNRGFELCSGEIVFFLDCDDALCPDVVERVVAAWTPQTSKIHFKLQKIDDAGAELPGAFLPPYLALPSGDLRPLLDRFGFYPAPPTSGNAFARTYLRAVMPLPAQIFRIEPDTPLVGMAPLFGTVGRLDGHGGFWRQGATNHSSGGLGLMHREIAMCDRYIDLANERTPSAKPFAAAWPFYLKRKLILAKFDGAGTSRSDLMRIARQYIACVAAWPEFSLRTRLTFIAWALAMATAPRSLLSTVPGIAGQNIKIAEPTAQGTVTS